MFWHYMSMFLFLLLCPHSASIFSHLFPGSHVAHVNMSPVTASLQQLHDLHNDNRVIDVINVVH